MFPPTLTKFPTFKKTKNEVLAGTVVKNMTSLLTKIKIRTYVLAALVFISSCRLIPCPWDSDLDLFDEKPKNELLIGKYQFDQRTLNHVPGYDKAQNAKLELNVDGTFEMTGIPKGTFDHIHYHELDSTTVGAFGHWTAGFDEGTAELNVRVKFDSAETDLKDFWTSWKIYLKDKNPIILIVLGDPDSCLAARFEKG